MTQTMEETAMPRTFSFSGGPLHLLGRRLGLVRGGTNSLALGLALGAFLWAVAVVLSFAGGVSREFFSFSAIGGHVRLLVVIPLFFLCETWLFPRITAFVSLLVRSGVVPKSALPSLKHEIGRGLRWKDSWLAEAICLLLAILVSLSGQHLALTGATSAYDPSRAGGASTAGLWYWMVCLPLFRFLIIRWVWRLGLWSHFLWRVAKLELKLVPTHPDSAGGLGYLEIVQLHFAPMVLAISVTQAAALAEEVHSGAMVFEGIFPSLALVLVVDAALFIGPLLIFTPRLWACRVKGLSDYMELAASYVRDFDKKWVTGGKAPEEPLLGTADVQSLADLFNSINIVRNMRVLTMSLRTLAGLVITALIPMLPLLLFKYPIGELTQKLFARLAGL